MDVSYLRVKNWGDLQHYAKRNPPWIKLYRKLLEDNAFMELDELEQWQLVRIWLVASRSDVTTPDEEGRAVPLLAYSEPSIRRAIGTLKKVPLEKFIRAGWLIPMSPEEVDSASTGASTDASAPLAKGRSETASLAPQRYRDTEEQKEGFTYIVDSWMANAPPLIRHRDEIRTSTKAKRAVLKGIDAYGLEDAVGAVVNYAKVLGSSTHYFKHKWTLPEFFTRGLHKFVDEAEPLTNFAAKGSPRQADRGMTFNEILGMNEGGKDDGPRALPFRSVA